MAFTSPQTVEHYLKSFKDLIERALRNIISSAERARLDDIVLKPSDSKFENEYGVLLFDISHRLYFVDQVHCFLLGKGVLPHPVLSANCVPLGDFLRISSGESRNFKCLLDFVDRVAHDCVQKDRLPVCKPVLALARELSKPISLRARDDHHKDLSSCSIHCVCPAGESWKHERISEEKALQLALEYIDSICFVEQCCNGCDSAECYLLHDDGLISLPLDGSVVRNSLGSLELKRTEVLRKETACAVCSKHLLPNEGFAIRSSRFSSETRQRHITVYAFCKYCDETTIKKDGDFYGLPFPRNRLPIIV